MGISNATALREGVDGMHHPAAIDISPQNQGTHLFCGSNLRACFFESHLQDVVSESWSTCMRGNGSEAICQDLVRQPSHQTWLLFVRFGWVSHCTPRLSNKGWHVKEGTARITSSGKIGIVRVTAVKIRRCRSHHASTTTILLQCDHKISTVSFSLYLQNASTTWNVCSDSNNHANMGNSGQTPSKDGTNLGPVIFIFDWVLWTITTTIVLLRLATRIWITRNPGWDDGIIALTQVDLCLKSQSSSEWWMTNYRHSIL